MVHPLLGSWCLCHEEGKELRLECWHGLLGTVSLEEPLGLLMLSLFLICVIALLLSASH